ncbi:rab11 family-interacting protein 1 isoform X2 [Anopheles bellator]|uniref:rab11 family-interacting protein 1 isoform X2 n=1 Tax=Anopheles bellator TaxID=139047 RepID=UPI0026488B1E|nr:rab11 family-interacting protein 1 isoform X2 [Anopheles bellator]
MWSPTHIQVTVQRARGLLIKGKQGTNNCFVVIALGKEKFQTSIQEKASESVTWNEECELQIPSQGNQAQLVLTALHHNSVGMDEFLGRVVLPLNVMDIYDLTPRSRWYKLESKGKDRERKKEKERGELEVRISFTVKAGSLTDLSKKVASKSSISNLASSVGGSLVSIAALEKRKGLKKLAKSLGSKMHIPAIGRKGGKERTDGVSEDGSYSGAGVGRSSGGSIKGAGSQQTFGDADPGVISEDEDEFVLDNLSHKSSSGSVHQWRPEAAAGGVQRTVSSSVEPGISKTNSSSSLTPDVDVWKQQKPAVVGQDGLKKEKFDEWEQKLYGKHLDIGSTDSLKRRSWESTRVMLTAASGQDEQKVSGAAEQSVEEQPVAGAPSEDQGHSAPNSPKFGGTLPKPLPRANSENSRKSRGDEAAVAVALSSPAVLGKLEGVKLEKESFTAKFKHFIKDHAHTRVDTPENLSPIAASVGAAGAHRKQRIVIGDENGAVVLGQRISKAVGSSQLSPETLAKYDGKSRDDMVRLAHNLENEVHYQKQKVKELEDYLDSLLLKVMECHPKILQNPYQKANPTKSG